MRRKILSFAMSIVLIMSMGVSAFAQGNNKGGGNGTNKAFTLTQSTIKDGEKDVELTRNIVLKFSKNIASFNVKENNQKCFNVKDKDGKDVVFDVIIADDQIEHDKRNDITIKLTNGIEQGEKYIITISKNIACKSGQTLDKDYTFTFTTSVKSLADTGAIIVNYANYDAINQVIFCTAIVAVFGLLKTKKYISKN